MAYGPGWLDQVVQYIAEDQYEQWTTLLSMMPVARTPMAKEDAAAMRRYLRKLQDTFDSSVPWMRETRWDRLRKKVGPKGGVVVVLDDDESAQHPLFKDAQVVKE